MATNEILPFASTNTGTNLLTQSEYSSDAQRSIGHQPGIARAKLENKVLRQASLIAAGLAEFIADNQANNITDALTPQNIADYLQAALTGALGVTPPQFDNDTSLATTEFVRRALGSNASTKSYSANATLTAADVGKLVVCSASGGFTLTLPAASAVQDGGAIEIFNGAGSAITVQRAGTNTIWADANGYTKTSMTVGSGDTLRVISNGSSGWILADCSVAATYSALFGASISSNGYQKLPSGLIIQWGTTACAANVDTWVSLPVAFPISFYTVVNSSDYSPNTGAVFLATSGINSLSMFSVRHNSAGAINVHWVAIGR